MRREARPSEAACARSGRLKSRTVPTEKTLARVCREAGATARTNVKQRDVNISVNAMDKRSIEVLARGLPPPSGRKVGDRYHVEVSVDNDKGAMSRWWRSSLRDSRNKPNTSNCWKVTVAVRSSLGLRREACLARRPLILCSCQARDSPHVLRRSTNLAWRRRWLRMLACLGPARSLFRRCWH